MRFLRATCAIAVCVLPTNARAALPAETDVPGESRTAVALPLESALPSYAALQREPDGADGAPPALEPRPPGLPTTDATPADATPAATASPSGLPSEQTLPDAPSDAANTDALANDLPLKGISVQARPGI
jgi:hypothetical protein